MFTGLVQELGVVRSVSPIAKGIRLEIGCSFSAFVLGESIAVDGACLTVVAMPGGAFAAEVSAETLEKTTLGELRAGKRVHLERALALGDRLGGHLVSGHVDGLGKLVSMAPLGDALTASYEVPPALGPFLAPK